MESCFHEKFIFDLFHIFVVCVVVMVACRESLSVPHFQRLSCSREWLFVWLFM